MLLAVAAMSSASPDLWAMNFRDSLRIDLQAAVYDSTRSRLHALIAFDMRYDSADMGLKHAQRAVELSNGLNDSLYIAFAEKYLGIAYEYAHQPDRSLPLLQISQRTYLDWGYQWVAADLRLHIARVWEDLGRMDMARDELKTAIVYFDSVEDHRSAAYAHNFLGLVYWNLGDFAEAEYQYKKSLFHRHQYPATWGRARVMNNLGVLYYNWSRYDDALEYYKKAEETYTELHNPKSAALVKTNMGEVYQMLGQDSLARETLLQARQIGLELEAEKVVVNAENWLGILEFEDGDYADAETHFQKFIEYHIRYNDQSGIARGYIHLGRVALARADYAMAVSHFTTALSNAIDIQNKKEEARAHQYLGKTLLLRNQRAEARRHLMLALSLAETEQYLGVKEDVLHTLGGLELILGNSRSAQHYFVRAADLRDSLFNESLQKRISELQTRFKLEEKDHEINLLKKEAQLKESDLARARTIRHFFISAFVILAGTVLLTYRQYRLQVSARKIIEKQQAHLEELNSQLKVSIAERDSLFRILGHDLRGPMGSFTELLQAVVSMPSMREEELREILESMNTSARSLYRLVENLLKWAQVQTGTLEMHLEPFDLEDLLKEVSALYQTIAKSKHIELSFTTDGDLRMHADLDMIYTILRNLVSNALKFTPEHGKVTVRADASGDGQIRILVKDNGIGIPEKALGTLFSPGEVLRRKGTSGEPSTGLGLVLVKEFVEQNNGTLELESEVDKGTSISVGLPSEQADPTS